MSFTTPVLPPIARQSIDGMEAMFAKMWDPPNQSPLTPDLLAPTNPVPEVMLAAGHQSKVTRPHTVNRHLMHGQQFTAWDGKSIMFFLFQDTDNPATGGGNYPAATIRVPRGVIFHSDTQGAGPPPHTIHWHGIEPTPINDGVGHCSMEIGQYTYQWQPNHIGTYFYHCHRNTVQHFEFGLWGALLIEPPDAYFASIASTNPDGTVNLNPSIPIGACRDGKFRIAANVTDFPQFHNGFNSNPLTAPDPLGQFPTDPHAMTIPYDVEALWAFDDRDSRWSDLASDPKATYPQMGSVIGVNDFFHGNAGGVAGPAAFFAFNDFNSDYWYVTGVSVPGVRGGSGTIAPNIVIPPAINSGRSGTQVSINAQVGQTILIRSINGAYNTAEVRMPVDVLIIGADGRAFGDSPFRQYSRPFVLPANTPIRLSVARRGDAIFRPMFPFSGFASVNFFDTRSEAPMSPANRLFTARIPINIVPAAGTFALSGTVTASQGGQPISGVQMNLTGPTSQMVLTDASGNYSFAGLPNGLYTVTPSLAGLAFLPPERRLTINGANQFGQFFRGRSL